MERIIPIEVPTPFAVGTVNCYLVFGEKLTLVDAGVKTETAFALLRDVLAAEGLTVADIEQVVFTHHHPDHTGLADFLPETTALIAHELAVPWFRRDADFFAAYHQFYHQLFAEFAIDAKFTKLLQRSEYLFQLACTRPLTKTVRAGDRVPGLSSFTVLHVPGHAPTHIALYREVDGVVIGGDVLLHHISSNPLLEPAFDGGSERRKSLLDYNNSLRQLAALPIAELYTGHGQVVTNVADLVAERLRKQEERAYKVRDFLTDGPLTGYEACQRLFPTLYARDLFLTISETVGQLDFLVEIGEIEKQNEVYVRR